MIVTWVLACRGRCEPDRIRFPVPEYESEEYSGACVAAGGDPVAAGGVTVCSLAVPKGFAVCPSDA